MKKLNMLLKVKLRLYVLLHTVNILYCISPSMANRLYTHIQVHSSKRSIACRHAYANAHPVAKQWSTFIV